MSDCLAEGLELLGLSLPIETIEKEILFLDELLRWNRQINLTSIKNREAAIEKHLLDSLVLLPHFGGSELLLDLGSGGGFPGIPLAIALPSLQVESVDSVGKKINFQKHIKRLLQLDNLAVTQARVEVSGQLGREASRYDLIVSRAFSSLSVFLSLATPRLKPGGRLLAMKGSEGYTELGAVEEHIKQLNLSEPTVFTYQLPFSGDERQLLVLKKQTAAGQ